MLAICEECSKKYNVDEAKIKGERARFSCQECGHVITVVKQKKQSHTTLDSTFAPASSGKETA